MTMTTPAPEAGGGGAGGGDSTRGGGGGGGEGGGGGAPGGGAIVNSIMTVGRDADSTVTPNIDVANAVLLEKDDICV